jgi:hypothetical protein
MNKNDKPRIEKPQQGPFAWSVVTPAGVRNFRKRHIAEALLEKLLEEEELKKL